MKRLLSLIFLIALPSFAATISGTVTPAGMTVEAYDAAGFLKASAATDAAGRYTLTVPAGSYRVLAFDPTGAYATSFYPDAESFETSTLLDVQTSATNINFQMFRGGIIAGTITSKSVALSGITIAAYNPDGTTRGFTRSDATGHYQLVLPPGTYRLAAFDDAKHYLTAFYSDAVSFAAANPVAVLATQTTTANFALSEGAKVSGVISDARSGAPIANAVVAFYVNGVIASSATTDDAGVYSAVLPAGGYRIVAFDPAGAYAATYLNGAESFDGASVFTLLAGDTKTINATLVRAGRLNGHVADAQSGAPLAGVTVAAFNAGGSTRAFTTTDVAGNYTLVVPPGSYRVGAYDTNLVYLRRFYPNEAQFAAASLVVVFESQTSSVNLTLPRGAVLTGQVTNDSFAALAGIVVAAYDSAGAVTSTTTDAAGRYRLLLDLGIQQIAAFDPAFHYANGYTSVGFGSAGEMQTKDFVLVAGAHVSGVVTNNNGAPVAGITVAAFNGFGDIAFRAVTGAEGAYDLMVAPGTYPFAAMDAQNRYSTSAAPERISLSAGQLLTLSFRVTPIPLPRHRAVRH
jgi:5-hydroxyisourate hydrolase-like protein (transthyretin family)